MSQFVSKNISLGKGHGTYQVYANLQRRNPINQKRITPILCKFCEEKITNSRGRKKYWTTINQLHGHCSYDHSNENFKQYLLELVETVLQEELS